MQCNGRKQIENLLELELKCFGSSSINSSISINSIMIMIMIGGVVHTVCMYELYGVPFVSLFFPLKIRILNHTP